jgi:hypothetical protein
MTAARVSDRRARPLPRIVAGATWAFAIGVPLGIGALVLVSPAPEQDAWAIPLYSLIVAIWGMTGAFLVTRRPDNLVGFVLLTVGLGIGIAILGQLWAALSLARHDGSLPGTIVGAMLGLLFFSALSLVMLVPLLFPDGRLMSRRWAAVSGLLLLSTVAQLVGFLLRPGPLEGMPGLDNPLGVPALAGPSQALMELGGLGALVCLPAGIVAAVLRYRRGTPVERKQLQWFGSVIALSFSMFLLATVLPQPYGQLAWIVASVSLGLVPVAIAVAILRYRLYEIDRIVSRTIGWTLVTGILVGLFVAAVIGLQAALDAFTQGETLAVAVSTLVAAALFQPVRRRVQDTVDRRFNRSRVDAQRAVDAFGTQLRDEANPGRVERLLTAAAAAAVHPRGVAVWVRRGEGSR